MNKTHIIITVASWEDRFFLGLHKLIKEGSARSVILYYFDGVFAEWSLPSRRKVARLCKAKGVELVESQLRFDQPRENWCRLEKDLEQSRLKYDRFTVQISTMPRDIIWSCFWMLDYLHTKWDFVYDRPERYAKWLSRDPQKPRLMYKMSGCTRLGAPTLLVLLLGLDFERAYQLIEYYEPTLLLVGTQSPRSYPGLEDAAIGHVECFRQMVPTRRFDVDAFSGDNGYSAVWDQLAKEGRAHNVVMSSLGPKPSAVALYHLVREHPDFGLAYPPSNEYNRHYSVGLSDSLRGSLQS